MSKFPQPLFHWRLGANANPYPPFIDRVGIVHASLCGVLPTIIGEPQVKQRFNQLIIRARRLYSAHDGVAANREHAAEVGVHVAHQVNVPAGFLQQLRKLARVSPSLCIAHRIRDKNLLANKLRCEFLKTCFLIGRQVPLPLLLCNEPLSICNLLACLREFLLDSLVSRPKFGVLCDQLIVLRFGFFLCICCSLGALECRNSLSDSRSAPGNNRIAFMAYQSGYRAGLKRGREISDAAWQRRQ
jgi:hypothetical protein